MAKEFDVPIGEEEIREELERILASSDFLASDRNRRFLKHVVEETLAGRGERIKAYSIATNVFGRPDDFDPLQDSIVRIEAARLRRTMERFYLLEGDREGLRILIPKGAYIPDFSRQRRKQTPVPVHETETSPPPQALHEFGPRLLVEQFGQEGGGDLCPTIARTLTRQVILALTRFTELFVYGCPAAGDGGEGPVPADVDYRLSGTLTLSQDRLHADMLMSRASDGRFIWAQSFDRDLGGAADPARILDLCTEVAGHIARVVALRDGVIDSQARDSSGAAPRHFAGFQKLLDFQDYWRTLDASRFEGLRRDLEATIEADPQFSVAFACLSLLYSNAARYSADIGPSRAVPLQRALDLAREAVRLAPSSSKGYHARAVAEWFLGRPDAGLATLRIARDLNPNDPELMAEAGFRHAMRMEWQSAAPLLHEAYARNPMLSGQYRMGLFLYHFAEGRFGDALRETHEMAATSVAHVHLAAAAALAGMERLGEARRRLDEAEASVPSIRLRLIEDLTFRQVHPQLSAAILRAIDRIESGGGKGRHPNGLAG